MPPSRRAAWVLIAPALAVLLINGGAEDGTPVEMPRR
jgi:hypothetical protein